MSKSIIEHGVTQSRARDIANDFIETRLHQYETKRNYDYGPGKHANVSVLSPYLRHRIITEEYLIKTAIKKYPAPKIEKFLQEIFWRTYWKGWMELRSQVWSDYKNLQNIELKNDKYQLFENILLYKSGIECFDFWTKELIETNYLHNHARMWYASIWIHTFKLPWHLGADLFLNNLLDGDPASNTLSWRWVAGLQTKGKAYLAKDWNIQKFTNGRFTPKETDFSSTPIIEPFIEYKMNSVKFHETKEIDWGNSGLLITTEDMDVLSCDKIRFPLKNAYILALSEVEEEKYSESVSDFKRKIADSSKKTLSENIDNIEIQSKGANQIKQIINWAKENRLKSIVTLACPYGHIRDFINLLKKELNKESIEIIKLYRDYDMKYWNLASASFFNFFKKAIQKI